MCREWNRGYAKVYIGTLRLTRAVRLFPVLQRELRLFPPAQLIYLAREESYSARSKKGDKCICERYVRLMAKRKARILLIDEDPARLSSAATILILSGYSVLPLSCPELFVTLKRGNYDWRFDLVLIRAVLDADTENLFETQLGLVPARKLSRAARWILTCLRSWTIYWQGQGQ